MTIETAVPSSAEALAALFDNLVEAVAQRVLAKLTPSVDAAIEIWASTNLEGRLETWADDHLDDHLDRWTENNLDIEGDIERAIRDLDLNDMIKEAVQALTFEVTVS